MFNNSDGSNTWWTMYENVSSVYSESWMGFWIASRYVYVQNPNYAGYGCFYGYGGGIQSGSFYYSTLQSGNTSSTNTVLPVVTLQTGIRGEKAQDGSWNLDV